MEEEKIKRSVSDTLNSISGIKRAEPNPFLFGRIMEEIKERQSTPKKFTTGYVWKLALVFIVMAMLNIFTLINYTGTDSGQETVTTQQDINSFINEYSLNNTTYSY